MVQRVTTIASPIKSRRPHSTPFFALPVCDDVIPDADRMQFFVGEASWPFLQELQRGCRTSEVTCTNGSLAEFQSHTVILTERGIKKGDKKNIENGKGTRETVWVYQLKVDEGIKTVAGVSGRPFAGRGKNVLENWYTVFDGIQKKFLQIGMNWQTPCSLWHTFFSKEVKKFLHLCDFLQWLQLCRATCSHRHVKPGPIL